LPKKKQIQLELTYTPEELGEDIVLAVGDQQQNIKLEGGQEIVWNVDPTTQWGNFYLCGPEFNRFDRSSTIEADLEHAPLRKGGEWREVDSDQMTLPIGIIRDYYLMQYIESPKAQDLLLDVASGNGIEVFVNGSSVMKHLNSYRCKHRAEKLLIHLNKGKNQVILRVYNRFEKEIPLMLRPAEKQVIYKQKVTLQLSKEELQQENLRLKVYRPQLATRHTDTELHNLSIKVK
jgi:alpha-L-fucosidase